MKFNWTPIEGKDHILKDYGDDFTYVVGTNEFLVDGARGEIWYRLVLYIEISVSVQVKKAKGITSKVGNKSFRGTCSIGREYMLENDTGAQKFY